MKTKSRTIPVEEQEKNLIASIDPTPVSIEDGPLTVSEAVTKATTDVVNETPESETQTFDQVSPSVVTEENFTLHATEVENEAFLPPDNLGQDSQGIADVNLPESELVLADPKSEVVKLEEQVVATPEEIIAVVKDEAYPDETAGVPHGISDEALIVGGQIAVAEAIEIIGDQNLVHEPESVHVESDAVDVVEPVIENIVEVAVATAAAPEQELEIMQTARETETVQEILPQKLSAFSEDIKHIEAATEEEQHEEEADEYDEGITEKIDEFDKLSRQDLVELLENTVHENDVTAIKSKIALIKVAFLKKEKEEKLDQYNRFVQEGGVPEDFSSEPDQLSERFNAAFGIYRISKQRYNDELEKQKLLNLEKKKHLLDELRTLINSEETLKKTYDEFKSLQDEWRQTGMVPKGEVNNLWQNYHFLVEKFFDKVKINKELKDLDLRKNLERKLDLCEKTEELLLETSITKSFKLLQQYHDDWKEIGPVPQDKKDEIWERFKTASDKINERRKEYFDGIDKEFEKNHLAKLALCDNAEKLIAKQPETLRHWQNLTQEINDLLRVWKTIGPAPKKDNNEVWQRFKSLLDTHFVNYKDYLEKLKDHQLNNYNLKVDLCVQAEALRLSADWKNTTRELIRLQKEWKEIGPVPRKHSDKIWKRFRTACDDFFERKSEHFKSLSEVEESNLARKEEILRRLESLDIKGNKSENLEILKDIQREWMEIGHVPIKEKDRLQTTFRANLNKHFDKLKISSAEVGAMQYRSRFESMKDQPDAGRFIGRERTGIQQKVAKLQEDIMLWENNIGFFAESKNASIVKKEFLKKIDQAKQELALLEAKLRYLRES